MFKANDGRIFGCYNYAFSRSAVPGIPPMGIERITSPFLFITAAAFPKNAPPLERGTQQWPPFEMPQLAHL